MNQNSYKEKYNAIYNWNRKNNWGNYKLIYKYCFIGDWFGFIIWKIIIKNSISRRYKELEKMVRRLEEKI